MIDDSLVATSEYELTLVLVGSELPLSHVVGQVPVAPFFPDL